MNFPWGQLYTGPIYFPNYKVGGQPPKLINEKIITIRNQYVLTNHGINVNNIFSDPVEEAAPEPPKPAQEEAPRSVEITPPPASSPPPAPPIKEEKPVSLPLRPQEIKRANSASVSTTLAPNPPRRIVKENLDVYHFKPPRMSEPTHDRDPKIPSEYEELFDICLVTPKCFPPDYYFDHDYETQRMLDNAFDFFDKNPSYKL